MIPLTVCVSGTPENWIAATTLCIVAMVAAWVNSIWRSGRFRILRVLVLASLLPFLFSFGWFPFYPTWRWDCGSTPDPNIQVYYAVMLWPALVLITSLILGQIKGIK